MEKRVMTYDLEAIKHAFQQSKNYESLLQH